MIKEVLSLKQENKAIKQENRSLKSKKHIKSLVSTYLKGSSVNPATAGMLVTGGRGRRLYLREDVAVGAVLKSMSRKTYRYIRKNKLLKLPSESTISQWLRDFNIRCNGTQHMLLKILSAKHQKPEDKQVWLSFDEMALKQNWTYDFQNKQALPPAKKLQVCMARGLITGWKLPVYFSTDEHMTLETLTEITESLENIGFTVRGASFDLGNKVFLSQVDFSKGTYAIQHPVDPRRKFFLLPDPPHLLKLMRNHILEKGVYFPRNPCEAIVEKPTPETIDDLVKAGEWIQLGK